MELPVAAAMYGILPVYEVLWPRRDSLRPARRPMFFSRVVESFETAFARDGKNIMFQRASSRRETNEFQLIIDTLLPEIGCTLMNFGKVRGK